MTDAQKIQMLELALQAAMDQRNAALNDCINLRVDLMLARAGAAQTKAAATEQKKAKRKAKEVVVAT